MTPSTPQPTPAIPLDRFRILIVCRGPIAMEALEVARDLGLPRPHIIVSKREVYESAEAFAPWAEHVDLYERLHVVDDYKDQDAILAICRRHGLQGVYVGYGMNAENADFVEACEKAGIVPIAPPSSVMRFSASKFRAKKHVRDTLGIRVLPGSDAAAALALAGEATDEELIACVEAEVEKIHEKSPGQIIRLKAVSSGGGKGQRLVDHVSQAAGMVRQIWAEIGARGVSGDKGVLVEANLRHPRHWEVQVLSDGETCVHFGARECSIQNAGSQKFVETGLHPVMFDREIERLEAARDAGADAGHAAALIALLRDEKARVEETCASAVAIMKSLGYKGTGTVEFLVAEDGGPEVFGRPHFMEINSRIQVEHRVSEAVATVGGRRVRLVGEQMRVFSGQKLGYGQDDIVFEGYSTELRINASKSNFLIGASGSVIERYALPPRDENFYYDDGGAAELFEKGRRRRWAVPNFDSNFGLAVFIGPDQLASYDLSSRLLERFEIHGNAQLETTRAFHLAALSVLRASKPYGKVRTDFAEILLAFGAIVHHSLSRLKASSVPATLPLRRLLVHSLDAFVKEPGLAIAFAFEEKRLRESGADGEAVARGALETLTRLVRFACFPEEAEAIAKHGAELPELLRKVLAAVAESRIFEWKRNDHDLEFFIPDNVDEPRERRIRIEELRDATVQGVTPRAMGEGETKELRGILGTLENKVVELIVDHALRDQLRTAIEACGVALASGRLGPAEFLVFFDELRRVKWTIRKARVAAEIETALMVEVNQAMRVIRGPNVVAQLAGTIFLRPGPGKPDFVRPGDEVIEDETVLALLENMKMFNEIRAHMSGRVREIRVENERPVLPGDILMVIE